jgi:hypothetical protein
MNKLLAAICLLTVSIAGIPAQDVRQIVDEAQRRSSATSQRYEGLLQVFEAKGRVSDKRWTLERIGSHGNSRAILKFTAPPEVKGVALLIVNHPDRASDQWMWTPAIGRDRRIALQDRSTRFFGTDFSFEDLEERDVNQYEYQLLGEETVDGASCWKIQSVPKERKSSQYTRSVVWIRKDNLRSNTRYTLVVEQDLYVYQRGDSAIVAINRQPQARTLTLSLEGGLATSAQANFQEITTAQQVSLGAGANTITIPALSASVFVLKP